MASSEATRGQCAPRTPHLHDMAVLPHWPDRGYRSACCNPCGSRPRRTACGKVRWCRCRDRKATGSGIGYVAQPLHQPEQQQRLAKLRRRRGVHGPRAPGRPAVSCVSPVIRPVVIMPAMLKPLETRTSPWPPSSNGRGRFLLGGRRDLGRSSAQQPRRPSGPGDRPSRPAPAKCWKNRRTTLCPRRWWGVPGPASSRRAQATT